MSAILLRKRGRRIRRALHRPRARRTVMSDKSPSGPVSTYTRGRCRATSRSGRSSAAAGVWGLWGLGVAAVISGDFSGWNFGIGFAGWGGMLIAIVIIVVMYFGMIFSIGEMSAAMPHTGGAYSFARSAMGPWGGFVTGLAETIEYVVDDRRHRAASPASYADAITRRARSELLDAARGCGGSILYVRLHRRSTPPGRRSRSSSRSSCRSSRSASSSSSASLALFSGGVLDWASSVRHRARPPARPSSCRSACCGDPVRAAVRDVVLPRHRGAAARRRGVERPGDGHPPAGHLGLRHPDRHRPAGAVPQPGVIGAEATGARGRAAARRLPRVRRRRARGAAGALRADRPARFAAGHHVRLRAQHVLPLARGLLPEVPLAHRQAADAVGRAGRRRGDRLHRRWSCSTCSPRLNEGAGAVAGAIVLNIAVWGAVLAYLLQMVAFVILRRKFPNAKRPYESPWGVPGAVVAGIIAALHLPRASCSTPTFVPAIIAIVIVVRR